MGYHAKALEQLTKAYKNVMEVNEETDLHDFNKIVTEKGMVLTLILFLINNRTKL